MRIFLKKVSDLFNKAVQSNAGVKKPFHSAEKKKKEPYHVHDLQPMHIYTSTQYFNVDIFI